MFSHPPALLSGDGGAVVPGPMGLVGLAIAAVVYPKAVLHKESSVRTRNRNSSAMLVMYWPSSVVIRIVLRVEERSSGVSCTCLKTWGFVLADV